jgi:hypothetical protein
MAGATEKPEEFYEANWQSWYMAVEESKGKLAELHAGAASTMSSLQEGSVEF